MLDIQLFPQVSDREFQSSNIWTVSLDGSDLKPVNHWPSKDVRWFSVASKVPLGVYERDFDLWLIDLTTGDSNRIQLEAPTESKENRTFYLKNAPVSEFRLSPDGKKIAAVVRGDIFVLSSEGGYARNITYSSWRERDIDWDKESKNIVYVSDVEANPDLYIISALGKEKPFRLTRSKEDEIIPRFSPDGKWIAYFSGKRQLRLVHADGSQGHLLVEDDFGGNVHDRVLQALTKPVYAKWRIRSLSETPQSTFGFTTKPVILVVNEVTLSDGEMTANGFKTLKRGPVIGNTTYGWLIFTTSVSLMNGGYFRLPFWGCYTLDGKDLGTSSGVKPDVMVVNDLNHELQNQDPQLQKAIELALKAIKK